MDVATSDAVTNAERLTGDQGSWPSPVLLRPTRTRKITARERERGRDE